MRIPNPDRLLQDPDKAFDRSYNGDKPGPRGRERIAKPEGTFLDETDMTFSFKMTLAFDELDTLDQNKDHPHFGRAVNTAMAEATESVIRQVEALPSLGSVAELRDDLWGMVGEGVGKSGKFTVNAKAKVHRRKK